VKLFRVAFVPSFKGFRTDAQCRAGTPSGGIYRAGAKGYHRANEGNRMTFLGRALVRIAFALALLQIPAHAQSVADFYRGKSIDLDIGYSVGGGYDLYARLIARRLGGHIPGNATIVPKNMEGAGSLRLANYLYAAAPNDGAVIGATSRGAAFDPLLGETGAVRRLEILLDRQRQ
jgi:hypothetical protein